MEYNTVMQSISTVGFPIVMCIALLYYFLKTDEKNDDRMDKITEAVNNNTIAMTKIIERIDKK